MSKHVMGTTLPTLYSASFGSLCRSLGISRGRHSSYIPATDYMLCSTLSLCFFRTGGQCVYGGRSLQRSVVVVAAEATGEGVGKK